MEGVLEEEAPRLALGFALGVNGLGGVLSIRLRMSSSLGILGMFESAKQKIHRADHHISDLERQFAAFVAEKPHRLVIETDAISGDTFLRLRFLKPIPPAFALIIGDAVHNMRCALDHIAWELVGRDGGTQDRYLKFPTGDSRINFESSCQGIKTPSQAVKDAFKITEAFPGGRGAALYDLKLFNDADKHTAIQSVLRASERPPYRVIDKKHSTIHTVGWGQILGGDENGANLARAGPGLSIEIDDDAECTPSIFITKPNFRFEGAIAMLKRFFGKVRDATAAIERRFPE